LLFRTSYLLKNMVVKVKINYPDTLGDIFKRYTVSVEKNTGSPTNYDG
jgi:hypothetical protein